MAPVRAKDDKVASNVLQNLLQTRVDIHSVSFLSRHAGLLLEAVVSKYLRSVFGLFI